MKRLNSAILTGTLLLGSSLSAHAASILASGAVYGGPSQDHVACQVYNANNTPITVVSTQIFSQTSLGAIGLSFNNCKPSLAPNSICTFQGAANDEAYACKVVINQSKVNVRGTMAALADDNTQLSEADLR